MACTIQDRRENIDIVSNDAVYKAEVDSAIHSFLGSREEMSSKNARYHKKTEDLLHEFLINEQLFVGLVSAPTDFIHGLRDYIFRGSGSVNVLKNVVADEKFRLTKKEIDAKQKLDYSPDAMLNIYNKTYRLMKMIYDTKEKDISKFAELLRDPFIVSIKYDRTGGMSKFFKHIKSFTDRKEQVFSNLIFQVKPVLNKRNSIITKKIFVGLGEDEINEYIADGISGFNTIDLQDINSNNKEVKILSVSGWKDAKNIKVKVEYKETGVIAELDTTTKPKKKNGVLFKENVAEEIISKIQDKYINELFAEVMNGQIAHIKVGGMPTASDAKAIKRILKEENIRYNTKDSIQSGLFHSVVDEDGIKYTYVLVKQDEQKNGQEEYIAYLYSMMDEDTKETRHFYTKSVKSKDANNFEYVTKSNFKETLGFKNLNVLVEGYYKSNHHDTFGTKLNSSYNWIEGSKNRQFVDFKKIEHSKINEALSDKTFWETVNTVRGMLRIVPPTVRNSQKEDVARIIAATEYLKKYPNDPIIKDIIKIFNLDDMSRYSFYDIKNNYFPNMYNKKQTDDMNIAEINHLKSKIKDTEDEVEIEDLNDKIDALEQKLTRLTYEDEFITNQQLAFSEHRTAIMPGTDIRKDGNVIADYLKFVSYTIEKNRASALALETVIGMIKNNNNSATGLETQIKYLINKSKQAFGDADVDIPTMFPVMSNQRLADFVNMFKNDASFKMSSEDAALLIKEIKSLVATVTLSSQSASQNRWQSVSGIIPFGYKKWKTARNILKLVGKPEDPYNLDEVFRHSGIDNVFSLLADIVFVGGETEDTDFGWFEVGAVKIPMPNMVDWVRLHRAGRKKFIEGTTFLDKHFKPLANRRLKILSKTFDKMEQKAKNEAIKEEVSYLKGIYYQIIFADKSKNNDRNLTYLFKELLTGITNNKLKEMVQWKLGWHLDEASESIKTFTGTEKRIRRELALMALLVADEKGLLGSHPDRFMSNDAVNIMRTASYLYAFGINKVFMPFMFEGTGGVAYQFKNYPINQLMLDSRNFQNLWDTTDAEGSVRKVGVIMKRIAKGAISYKQLFDPNFKDNTIDHDALQWVRGALIRGVVTGLSVIREFLKVIPFAKYTLPIQGLENPVMSLIGRMAARYFIMVGYGALSDRDKERQIQDFLFFIVPPFLSVFLNSMIDGFSIAKDAAGNIIDYIDDI